MILKCERGRFWRALKELAMSDEESVEYHRHECRYVRAFAEVTAPWPDLKEGGAIPPTIGHQRDG